MLFMVWIVCLIGLSFLMFLVSVVLDFVRSSTWRRMAAFLDARGYLRQLRSLVIVGLAPAITRIDR
jgi:hypothetical protein